MVNANYKKATTLILILFKCLITYAQSWTFTSGGNAFDGKYKTATCRGAGGEFPYQNPLFVINYFYKSGSLNIYLGDAGTTHCENRVVYLNFTGEDSIFSCGVSTYIENDIWFLEFAAEYSQSRGRLTIEEFFKKMKKYSSVNVRLENNCYSADYKFSLSGSTAAINYVTEDYFREIKKIQIEEKKALEAKIKYRDSFVKAMINKIEQDTSYKYLKSGIDSGRYIYKIINKNAFAYDKNSYLAPRILLQKHQVVVLDTDYKDNFLSCVVYLSDMGMVKKYIDKKDMYTTEYWIKEK